MGVLERIDSWAQRRFTPPGERHIVERDLVRQKIESGAPKIRVVRSSRSCASDPILNAEALRQPQKEMTGDLTAVGKVVEAAKEDWLVKIKGPERAV